MAYLTAVSGLEEQENPGESMTFWPLFYLCCAMVTMCVSAIAKDGVKFWLSVLLLWSWTLANICVWRWGYQDAPNGLALSELALAVMAASIGYSLKSRIALVVVCLFGLQEAVQVGSRILGREGDYLFYASLNVIYMLQLLVIGGASGAAALQRFWPTGVWSRAHGYLGASRTLK